MTQQLSTTEIAAANNSKISYDNQGLDLSQAHQLLSHAGINSDGNRKLTKANLLELIKLLFLDENNTLTSIISKSQDAPRIKVGKSGNFTRSLTTLCEKDLSNDNQVYTIKIGQIEPLYKAALKYFIEKNDQQPTRLDFLLKNTTSRNSKQIEIKNNHIDQIALESILAEIMLGFLRHLADDKNTELRQKFLENETEKLNREKGIAAVQQIATNAKIDAQKATADENIDFRNLTMILEKNYKQKLELNELIRFVFHTTDKNSANPIYTIDTDLVEFLENFDISSDPLLEIASILDPNEDSRITILKLKTAIEKIINENYSQIHKSKSDTNQICELVINKLTNPSPALIAQPNPPEPTAQIARQENAPDPATRPDLNELPQQTQKIIEDLLRYLKSDKSRYSNLGPSDPEVLVFATLLAECFDDFNHRKLHAAINMYLRLPNQTVEIFIQNLSFNPKTELSLSTMAFLSRPSQFALRNPRTAASITTTTALTIIALLGYAGNELYNKPNYAMLPKEEDIAREDGLTNVIYKTSPVADPNQLFQPLEFNPNGTVDMSTLNNTGLENAPMICRVQADTTNNLAASKLECILPNTSQLVYQRTK